MCWDLCVNPEAPYNIILGYRKLFGLVCWGREMGADCSIRLAALAKFGSLRMAMGWGGLGMGMGAHLPVAISIFMYVRIDEVATCSSSLCLLSLSLYLPLLVWLVGAFMVKCRRRHKRREEIRAARRGSGIVNDCSAVRGTRHEATIKCI